MTPNAAPERRETDDEREARERQEAEEARAARIAEVATMSDADLIAKASDDDLRAETARLASAPVPSKRGVLTVPRSRAHARLAAARQGLAGAATAAIVAAGRGAAKSDGPTLDELRRAHAFYTLAAADEAFWTALAAVVDGPAPRGMSEIFSDRDEVAEIRAIERAHEARRELIADELEAREVARRAAQHPGMAERIAKLVKGGGK